MSWPQMQNGSLHTSIPTDSCVGRHTRGTHLVLLLLMMTLPPLCLTPHHHHQLLGRGGAVCVGLQLPAPLLQTGLLQLLWLQL